MNTSARMQSRTRTRQTTERPAQRVRAHWRRLFGRRRFSPALLILIIVAGFFVISFVQLVVRHAQLEQYRATLQSDIIELEMSNAELRQQAEYFASPDYAERVAREQFGYAREGDVVLMPTFSDRTVLGPPATTTAPPPAVPAEPNWVDWLRLFNFFS
jgi:cell division protein FtsB